MNIYCVVCITSLYTRYAVFRRVYDCTAFAKCFRWCVRLRACALFSDDDDEEDASGTDDDDDDADNVG